MRTRPWPLVILAICQILTPVANVLFNAWMLKVEPRFVLSWILDRSPVSIFETMALMPIAGIAIWKMKSWSYPVFFAAMGWSVFANLRDLRFVQGTVPPFALVALYAAEILLAIYFLLPSVRRTYFDPRVRWWESKPRYEVQVPAQLIVAGGVAAQATLVNLSDGGAFITAPADFKSGQKFEIRFKILTLEFSVPGRVVHVRETATHVRSFGIQFEHTPETARAVQKLAQGLKEMGCPDRVAPLPWYQGLMRWVSTLLKTGKGWQPDVGPKP